MAFPTSRPDPEHLRSRAAELRRRAVELDRCELLRLAMRAGPEVWIGPTATAFRAELAGAVHHVRCAAEELRAAARRLEHEALLSEDAGRCGLPLAGAC